MRKSQENFENQPTLCLLLVVTSLLLAVMVATGVSQGVDETRQPDKGGTPVVDAVVNVIQSNCIFEDRLFLRRLAYVESRDGTDVTTYRDGYDGGIWQVDEDKFKSTVNCTSILATYCEQIRKPPFNIDWPKITWSDLRKPLFSGLAATLYLVQRLQGNTTAMPGDLQKQGALWAEVYRPGSQPSAFSTEAVNATQFDCSRPMDLAFILDSSGSINDASFNLSLDFAARVVDVMNIPEVVRVATIIFASSPVLEFGFSDNQSRAKVMAAIRTITRVSGSTATDLALDMALTSLFNTSSARLNAIRVVVLVTDGVSDNTISTTAAAQRMKDQGAAAVFSIGVGGYNLVELKAVASEPKCLHVFTLDDFSVINTIIYEIQRSTCTAHQTIATGTEMTAIEINTTKPSGPFVIPEQQPNKTVMFEVKCGSLDVYVSYTNPNPSPALYTEKYTAWDGRPAYLAASSSNEGRPVYISVVGTELAPSIAAIENCTGFRINIATVDKPWQLQCCKNDACRDCTDTDLLQQIDRLTDVCDARDLSFQNPCTPEALLEGKTIFPYLYDSNKFIRCDYHGNPYLTLCPRGQRFIAASLTCGQETSPEIYRRPLPLSYPSPCTRENLLAQHFFFKYPPERHLFIHCDAFGGAWLQNCAAQEMWNQDLLTCVVDHPPASVTTHPVTVTNPCTAEALAAGKFFHPYPCNHTRYIHCDVAGQYWVQPCPVGMFFDPEDSVCETGDMQPYTGCPH